MGKIGLCVVCAGISFILSYFPGAEMIRLLLILVCALCAIWSFLQTLLDVKDGSFENLIPFVACVACLFLAVKEMPGEKIVKTILVFAVGAGIISTVVYSLK